MVPYLLILSIISLHNDSLEVSQQALPKSRSKQVIINGFLSAGLGVATGIFHIRGNDAYTDYQNSTTSAEAVENWERTKFNDNVRNICAAGAVFFAARTLYYHIKNKQEEKVKIPKSLKIFELKCIDTSKWVICIKKTL